MEDDMNMTGSISENTTDPEEEDTTPDQTPEDAPGEQHPGQEEDTGKEDAGATDTEREDGSDSTYHDVDEEAIAERVAEMLQPDDEDTAVEDKIDLLLDRLALKTTEVSSDDAAVVQASTAIPIKGYRDWDYGITVDLDIYPYGLGYWTKVTEEFSTPEEFEARYAQWCSFVGDTVDSFYMTTIHDAGGNKVYDYETYQEPEPEEPEPEEPEEPVTEDGETLTQLLSHLEGINDTLLEMTTADMEFYDSVLLYQSDMLELQKTSVALEIIMAVGIFLIFGVLLVKIMMEKLR